MSAPKPFANEHRLRTRKQLLYVRNNGVRAVGKRCVISAVAPPDATRKYAMVISRRFSRKAVDRNRARRLLRESYRLLLPRLEAAWIVFIPRQRMRGATLNHVLPEVERLLDELGLLEANANGEGKREH